MQFTADLVDGEIDPSESPFQLIGNDSLGNDWTLSLSENGFLIGMPDSNSVRYAPLENYPNGGALYPGLTGTLLAEEPNDRFGTSIQRMEDLNANGVAELWVGAPNKEGGGGRIGAGAAYLLLDSGDGLQGETKAQDARLRILGDNAGDELGSTIATCADIDGDGIADTLLAAPAAQQGAPQAGAVTFLSSTILEALPSQVLAASLETTWFSDNAGAQLGRSIHCQSDFTGDGLADILLAAPFEDSDTAEASGAVHFIPGSPTLTFGVVHEAHTLKLNLDSSEAYFGSSMATGDVDGDGKPDLLVGAPGYNSGDGAVFLYLGAQLSDGILTPSVRFLPDEKASRWGTAVALSDLNNDGFQDVLVGAPRSNPTGRNRTFYSGMLSLFLWQEQDTSQPIEFQASAANTRWHDPTGYRRIGANFLVSDIDADGLDDLFLLMGSD